MGLAILVAAFSLRAATLAPWSGGPSPPLRANTLADQPFDLDARKGSVVIVNFWATWCAPCVAEMPSLQRLRDKLGVQVIAINFQENAARIHSFLQRNGIALPVVRDHDGSLRAAWRVNRFPSTFVIAPDGRVARMGVSEVDWDDPAIQSQIAALRQ